MMNYIETARDWAHWMANQRTERVFDAFVALSTEEQAQFEAMRIGFNRANNIGSTPAPKRPRGPGTRARGAAVSDLLARAEAL
jgi:hypothetical protein